MRIAYLILAHGNYRHLQKLIDALNDDCATFYVHIDKKAELPTDLRSDANVHFVDRVPVWWAGFSIVRATIRLLRAAVSHHHDYYVLLSGADYPIQPNSCLYAKLEEGGEFINMAEGFSEHKPEDRIRYYHFDCYNPLAPRALRTRIFFNLEKLLKRFGVQKRNYPFARIYHGSAWWALSHACADFVVQFIDDNPEYVDFFKTSWIPDEAFFQTIIGNSAFMAEVRSAFTYVDWSTDPAPAEINRDHLVLFKRWNAEQGEEGRNAPFFARKFGDASFALVEEIDTQLRCEHGGYTKR